MSLSFTTRWSPPTVTRARARLRSGSSPSGKMPVTQEGVRHLRDNDICRAPAGALQISYVPIVRRTVYRNIEHTAYRLWREE